MRVIFGLTLFISSVQISIPANAKDSLLAPEAVSTSIERVGGDFVISKIDRNSDGSFQIEFQPIKGGNSSQNILLVSDHVHSSVAVGTQVRLSAEIVGRNEKDLLASQVLLLIPGDQGSVPVWLLSRNYDVSKGLNAAPLLKQHAPQNDFLVL